MQTLANAFKALEALMACAFAFQALVLVGIAVGIWMVARVARGSSAARLSDGLLGGAAGGTLGGILGFVICAQRYRVTGPSGPGVRSMLTFGGIGLLEGLFVGTVVGMVFAWRALSRERPRRDWWSAV